MVSAEAWIDHGLCWHRKWKWEQMRNILYKICMSLMRPDRTSNGCNTAPRNRVLLLHRRLCCTGRHWIIIIIVTYHRPIHFRNVRNRRMVFSAYAVCTWVYQFLQCLRFDKLALDFITNGPQIQRVKCVGRFVMCVPHVVGVPSACA